MKTSVAVAAAAVLLAGGAVAAWKFLPNEKVPVKLTDKELRKGDAFPHELWTAVLRQHCRDGRVDYKAIHAAPAGLDAYLGYLARYSPQSHPDLFPAREDRLAYALNAYNAYVVKGVVDHWPVESVKQIGAVPFDFFRKFEYPFGTKTWTLEGWETWIRETFDEPRVHFALNCASIGCPRLPAEAFVPADLEKQLARETKAFVEDAGNVREEGGKAKLSSIFKWYRKDFEGWQEANGKPKDLLAWVREAGGKVPENAEIEFLDYDWGLNGAK